MEKVACGDFLGRAAVGGGFFFSSLSPLGQALEHPLVFVNTWGS